MTDETLTDMQLAFMRALWAQREGSVSEIQERLLKMGHDFAPTTVATVLRRMEGKGLVRHRKAGRQFIYSAARSQETMAESALRRISRSLFGGSVSALLCQLVQSDDVSDEDLLAIKKLIEDKEKRAHEL